MEAAAAPTGPCHHHLPSIDEKIKQKLLKNGVVDPTPKIIHTLRKKQLQKTLRKSNKKNPQTIQEPPRHHLELAEEAHFRDIESEYRGFMVGNPWDPPEEGAEIIREKWGCGREYYEGGRLRREHLRELSEYIEREGEKLRWVLDDDVEGLVGKEEEKWAPREKRRKGEEEAVRFLVDKLSSTELSAKDWKFSRMMNQSQLEFTEVQMLKIVGGLGDKGQWRHALSVLEWVYSSKERRHYKSRFVYTKILAVLGKARRPHEALQIFNSMRKDGQIYPDMPAYHSIAVTLGQAGYLQDLMKIIESMREKPPVKKIRNTRYKYWDPTLLPDTVIFNAVLNACVPSHQWKGVSWVFQQLRKNSLKPNGATYGLAMEVMLHSGKYDLVHEFFGKMKRSGEAPKALTYKVLVKAFWEEGKIDEAVEAVRDMERRGVVGTACVYYELACCLCNNGRWQEAMMEVMKLKKLPLSKPLGVTFTGMIMSSLEGRHVQDCISIFQHSKDHCAADIGMINAMLKVYGSNDMFSKAKDLFEETKRSENKSTNGFGSSLSPDTYTYTMMLKTSASSHQWEYFEFVYREMVLSGCVIDQSKHMPLLVKASIAGKSQLLEHAFDTILEEGEIPHVSFFTELICQAIIHCDFERAVSILNALAHAPSQISEKQWTELFERNEDRMSRENLNELLETLSSRELPMEATVSNLRRSLASYCRFNSGKEVVGLDGSANMKYFSANSSGSSPCVDLHDDSKRLELSIAYSNDDRKHDDDSIVSRSLIFDVDDDDEVFGESDDDSDDEFSRDFECVASDKATLKNVLSGNSHGTDQPSANEILQSWKQIRDKDDTFFHFRLGG